MIYKMIITRYLRNYNSYRFIIVYICYYQKVKKILRKFNRTLSVKLVFLANRYCIYQLKGK